MAESDDMNKSIRQLIMMVSSIRSQDQDHWESHVEFSNQVIDFIKKIEQNMNSNWERVNKSLITLNKSVEESLNSLLSGINPEGIKETSEYLKDIQDTMQKSITSMNLESIMQDLQEITGEGITLTSSGSGKKKKKKGKSGSKKKKGKKGAKEADEEIDLDEEGYTAEERQMIAAYQEIYGPGHIPEHMKKKKKNKDPHLMKPSDFFGM